MLPPTKKAASVCQYLTSAPPPKKNVTNLYHPAPVLFRFICARLFSVSQVENEVKRLHFVDVAKIQEAVTDELKKVHKEEFSAAFQKLYDRTKAYIYIYQWSLF